MSNNISPYIVSFPLIFSLKFDFHEIQTQDGQYSQLSCTLNQDMDYFQNDIGVIMMKFDIKNNR